MKRRFLLLIPLFCIQLSVSAQIQQGQVKTKGRMVNGQYVAGRGLANATVTIQGRSAVLSKDDGAFSFLVPANTFMVQSVQKNGYQLVDADATRKAYRYSQNIFYIVMETPDQQAEDNLAAERKIRRTLQQQLQKREDEIDVMKVSLEEKNRLLAALYKSQEDNEKLISEMAKEYSEMDYDQMDDLNRQICDAILNGELTRADSLLRSKGDINARNTEIDRRLKAESQRKEEIALEQAELAQSEAGTKKLLADFASDCMKYHNMFKLQNQHDSAMYYIELRALRDTTNAEWQFDAARYCQDQNQYNPAQTYYERALEIVRRLAQTNPQIYESDVASTLNNLAVLYYKTLRYSEAETMYKEALDIRRRQMQTNPQAYESYVAQILNNLANLYRKTQRYADAEAIYKEALDIRCRLAQTNPSVYEPDYAQVINNLAMLYHNTQRYAEAETMYKEALNIRRRLAQANPQAYESSEASTLNNLAVLYYDTQRYADVERMYKEALDIYRRLAQTNPQTYETSVALTLINLANRYYDTQRYADAETMYKEALNIYRRSAQAYPNVYESYVAVTLDNMAFLYSDTQRYADAETVLKEALDIYRRLAQANPQAYEPDVAMALCNMSFCAIFQRKYAEAEQLAQEGLSVDPTQHQISSILAAALLFQGKCTEAEKIYRQYKDELKDSFLDDFRQFAEAGVIPPEFEANVETIKRMLEE